MAKSTPQRWFLKEWRKYRGLTQEQLAERAGLSKPFISQLESGARRYTQETLEALAEVLGTEPGSLVMRDPSRQDAAWTLLETIRPQERGQVAAFLTAIRGSPAPEDAPPEDPPHPGGSKVVRLPRRTKGDAEAERAIRDASRTGKKP